VSDPIPEAELKRDQRVYKALKRHGLTDDQKRELFGLARGRHRSYTRADYGRFQRRLLKLAKPHGIWVGIRASDTEVKD